MIGVYFCLFNALCSTTKDVLSKRLSFDVDGTVSAFASFLFALPFYLIALIVLWGIGVEKFEIGKGFFFWIVLRSSSDAIAEQLKMNAFRHGDLSVVSALFSLYPVMLLIASPLITGDTISLRGAAAVAFTVFGATIVIYQPRAEKSEISREGVLYALGAAFFFSLNTCFDRLAVQSASPTLSGFSMTLLAGIFVLPFLGGKSSQLGVLKTHRSLFLQRGFMELIFMVSKLYALQFLQAPIVMGIQRISVIFSVISGKVIFQEKHFKRRLCGAIMVVAGVVFIIFEN